jgi:membrane protein
MIERLPQPIQDVIMRVRRRYAVDVLLRAWGDFSRDDGMVYAAAMTYYMLLSLFPFMIFLVSIFGLVVRDEALQERVVQAIIDEMPPGVNLDAQIESVIAGVAGTNTGLLGIVGIVGSAWTASAVFGALRRALNRAFNVPQARPFVHGRARDLVSVLCVILAIVTSLVLTGTLRYTHAVARDWFGDLLTNIVFWVVSVLLPLLVSFTGFMLIFRLIPNHGLRFRDLWIGALIAAVGFEMTKNLFSLYLVNFGNYDEVYGALGGAMAFLFFVFIVSNLTIFAADIGSELAKDRAKAGGRRQ